MDTSNTAQPARSANNVYSKPAANAVEFYMSDHDDGSVIIWSRLAGIAIGRLIPTGEGFRLVFSRGLQSDVGGGLVTVWPGTPESLRYDVVTMSQARLNLQEEQPSQQEIDQRPSQQDLDHPRRKTG